MKIIADKNMPLLTETFGRHGELQRLDGRNISKADLGDAEALLVRSVTRVDKKLLKGSKIRFVGSATIGMDHLDTSWLEANDITWAHAPGCNADAAAQYALALMWLACDRLNWDFRQQSVGIIGRGNVGSRLESLLKVLDIPTKACDPPLQDNGELQLVPMQEACNNSIVSLHLPLTINGKYPTRNLFNSTSIKTLRPHTLLVNTSRGGVIEKKCLLEQLASKNLNAALDVWPDEPYIGQDLLSLVSAATPHVAGYSREGKQAGTEMIYRAFCKSFSLELPVGTASASRNITLKFPPAKGTTELVRQCIRASSQVTRDDKALHALSVAEPACERVHIDSLRTAYPERYEFKSHVVDGVSAPDARLLNQLGFKTTRKHASALFSHDQALPIAD